MSMWNDELIEAATKALERSWSPYSGFSVGAALLARSGKVYGGTNVENASYGLTVCAERVAVFKAVSEGDREFEALALVCDGDEPVPPCGACLQVLREFAENLPIFMGNLSGARTSSSLKELLPSPFRFGNTVEQGT